MRIGGFVKFTGEEYTPQKLLEHEEMGYCPTKEDLEEYAKKHSEFFVYEEPLLLSTDRKIMYGFSAEDLEELIIPDEVEVYDNICIHSEEEERSYGVTIGCGLRKIVDTYECFGYHVTSFNVYNNPYFSDVDGILYDNSEQVLIAYPTDRYTDHGALMGEEAFIQLPDTTKKICAYAFHMILLPMALIIPDSVEIIEKGAFYEMYDKGLWMNEESVKEQCIILPERFRDVIDATWKEDDYIRPNIMYY